MNCLNCGKPTNPKGKKKKNYCSVRCSQIYNGSYKPVGEIIKICPECKQEFKTAGPHHVGPKKTYCSDKCLEIHERKYNTEYVRNMRKRIKESNK